MKKLINSYRLWIWIGIPILAWILAKISHMNEGERMLLIGVMTLGATIEYRMARIEEKLGIKKDKSNT